MPHHGNDTSHKTILKLRAKLVAEQAAHAQTKRDVLNLLKTIEASIASWMGGAP